MRSVLNGLASAAGAAGNAAAKNALKGIADALGQASATGTQATEVTAEHTLAVVQTFTQATTTGENDGGPGIGDQIQFLLNARLVWLASGGVLRMTLIGHDALVTRSVAALKANRNAEPSGISPAVVDALLALDPFVAGGPQAVLPADRFVHVETYDVNGGDLGISATRTISQTDLQASTRTDMKVEDMRAGALAFLGIGVPQTETVTTSLVLRSVAATTQSQTVSAGGTLFAGIDEQYVVEVLYDRVFGTFVFRLLPSAATPSWPASSPPDRDRSRSGQRSRSSAGGKRYVTTTDASGQWAFHVPDIEPGPLTIKAGSVTRTENFAGEPVKDIEIRLA